MARTGRRPGNQDTREAILAAARETFAERGFDGASIRAIATSAGVDPALVHHYFGTKDELFLATVEAPMDPAKLSTDCAVFDIIAARRTEFMQASAARGLRVVDGVAMIRHQLPLQTAFWRGEA